MILLVLMRHILLVIRLDIPTVALIVLHMIWPYGQKLKSRFWWIMLSVGLLRQIFYHVQAVLKTVLILKMFFSNVTHQVRRAWRSSLDLFRVFVRTLCCVLQTKIMDQLANWDHVLFSLFGFTNRCRKQCFHSSCSFIHRHWFVSIRWVKWKRRHIDGQKKWYMGFS